VLVDQSLKRSCNGIGSTALCVQMALDFGHAARARAQVDERFLIGSFVGVIALQLFDLGVIERLTFGKARRGHETDGKGIRTIIEYVNASGIVLL
jgi:hypothetical protein